VDRASSISSSSRRRNGKFLNRRHPHRETPVLARKNEPAYARLGGEWPNQQRYRIRIPEMFLERAHVFRRQPRLFARIGAEETDGMWAIAALQPRHGVRKKPRVVLGEHVGRPMFVFDGHGLKVVYRYPPRRTFVGDAAE
jgi:hypothetical protein